MELKIKNRKHAQPAATAEEKKEAAETKEKALAASQKEDAGRDESVEQKPAQAPEGKKEEAPLPPEEEIARLKDRLLRTMADFDNFRKRTLREKTEIYRRANEDLMRELLPVLDHLDLALESVNADGLEGAHIEGFKIVAEQVMTALKKFGLDPIGAAGQPFDPAKHEAISHVPSAEVPADMVAAEVRRGYTLGGRLLRASRVVVSSGMPEETPSPAEDQPPQAEGGK